MKPITNEEKFYNAILGNGEPPAPVTRQERYLHEIWKNGVGGGSGANADWYAAEGEPAYIANKPFWKEVVAIYSFPSTTLTTVFNEQLGFAMVQVMVGIRGDCEYKIIFDGVTYDHLAFYYSNVVQDYVIGSDEISEYPFFIEFAGAEKSFLYTKTAGTHTVEGYAHVIEIKYSYLPKLTVNSTWSTDTKSASITVEEAQKIVNAFDNGIPCYVDVRTAKSIVSCCMVVDIGGIAIYAVGFGLGGFITVRIDKTTGAIETTKYAAAE